MFLLLSFRNVTAPPLKKNMVRPLLLDFNPIHDPGGSRNTPCRLMLHKQGKLRFDGSVGPHAELENTVSQTFLDFRRTLSYY